jgi:hypothetical protein
MLTGMCRQPELVDLHDLAQGGLENCCNGPSESMQKARKAHKAHPFPFPPRNYCSGRADASRVAHIYPPAR